MTNNIEQNSLPKSVLMEDVDNKFTIWKRTIHNGFKSFGYNVHISWRENFSFHSDLSCNHNTPFVLTLKFSEFTKFEYLINHYTLNNFYKLRFQRFFNSFFIKYADNKKEFISNIKFDRKQIKHVKKLQTILRSLGLDITIHKYNYKLDNGDGSCIIKLKFMEEVKNIKISPTKTDINENILASRYENENRKDILKLYYNTFYFDEFITFEEFVDDPKRSIEVVTLLRY